MGRTSSLLHGVRATWLIGVSCSALSAALLLVALWISSTVPGTNDENSWGSDGGAQVAIAISILGFLGLLVGFLICATLLIIGGIRLRRCSCDERRTRMKEIACNAIGVVIPIGVILAAALWAA